MPMFGHLRAGAVTLLRSPLAGLAQDDHYCLEPSNHTMVLKILEAVAASKYFPRNYLWQISFGILALWVIRAFFQGKKTTWERDLHARTILITAGFTPSGLTLLQILAERGAHIIALSPDPIDSPNVALIVDLLRTTTKNEQIYADHCDLTSPHSIREFCTRFLTGKDQRLDCILFLHEYQHIGATPWLSKAFGGRRKHEEANRREKGSLATFLITTLLLPALLIAPAERDIRIINVVNPFYAAAAGPSFHVPNSSFSSPDHDRIKSKTIVLEEGTRSLRTVILTCHLQRILDALPSAGQAQVPKTEEGSSTVPVVSDKLQKSNIVAVSVSPGISRIDTVAPLLNADWSISQGTSVRGTLIYILLQPLLRIFTKTPYSSMQSVLHALFLPTPFKVSMQGDPKGASPVTLMEVVKPGALYTECAVIHPRVPPPTDEQLEQLYKVKSAEQGQEGTKPKKGTKGKGKASPENGKVEEVLKLEEDHEYGGEVAGRLVWEAYEDALKFWEASSPPPPPPPPSSQSSAKAASSSSTVDSSASEKSPYD